jgi:hypothetical protein
MRKADELRHRRATCFAICAIPRADACGPGYEGGASSDVAGGLGVGSAGQRDEAGSGRRGAAPDVRLGGRPWLTRLRVAGASGVHR